MQGGAGGPAGAAAGSATDAVLRRRNDALIRGMILRLYRVIATGGAEDPKKSAIDDATPAKVSEAMPATPTDASAAAASAAA